MGLAVRGVAIGSLFGAVVLLTTGAALAIAARY
jgi:hypothetical protein